MKPEVNALTINIAESCRKDMTDIKKLAEKIVAQDRRALSRAITLVESSREDHLAQAVELVQRLHQNSGQALRIGLSGTPGLASLPSSKPLAAFLQSKAYWWPCLRLILAQRVQEALY